MQGMPKLMEGGGHIVDGEEAGLRICGIVARSREVAHIHNDGPHAGLFLAEIVHPGAAAFGGAHIVIPVENADEAAVRFQELVSLHRGVIHLHFRRRLDANAIDALRGRENTLKDAVGLEIGFGLGLVQGVLLRTHFLCIVAPVPGLDFVAGELFHIGPLLFGLTHGRVHDGLQEGIHRGGVSGHFVGQLKSGEGRIAQELCHLGP